jgi:hypothetical protein
MTRSARALLATTLLLGSTSAGFPSWSANPAANLAVADGAGEQVLPIPASTSDGGLYVGWFDGSTGSYRYDCSA